ncbi:hypothetical protein PINS_up005878 [Pythium insidiosum]|nr:hypothetical protein PINS_up005878 [Pythium insidiosum]
MRQVRSLMNRRLQRHRPIHSATLYTSSPTRRKTKHRPRAIRLHQASSPVPQKESTNLSRYQAPSSRSAVDSFLLYGRRRRLPRRGEAPLRRTAAPNHRSVSPTSLEVSRKTRPRQRPLNSYTSAAPRHPSRPAAVHPLRPRRQRLALHHATRLATIDASNSISCCRATSSIWTSCGSSAGVVCLTSIVRTCGDYCWATCRPNMTGENPCCSGSDKSTASCYSSITTFQTQTAAPRSRVHCARFSSTSHEQTPRSSCSRTSVFISVWSECCTRGQSAIPRAGTCKALMTCSRRSWSFSSPCQWTTRNTEICRLSRTSDWTKSKPTRTGASPSCSTASKTTTHLPSQGCSAWCSAWRSSCTAATRSSSSISSSARACNSCSFAFRWMNCLLMREVPLNAIIRLWDTYLCEDSGFEGFHVYVCAAILMTFGEKLKTLEFQDLVLFLQHLPTKDWNEDEIDPLLSRAFILQTYFADSPSHLS